MHRFMIILHRFMNNHLSIGETAKLLGVSIDTLRRWDKSGRLKSVRKSTIGHRYYRQQDIESYQNDLFELARKWVIYGSNVPDDYYCSNSAVFQARLIKLQERLGQTEDKRLKKMFSLVVAVVGEIGNNSFDHNLGNWPNIPGVFFAYDLNKRIIVLADRGQGILTTLKRAVPSLRDDQDALKTAFTKIISGRAPETRGNGLKFVREVIIKNQMQLNFQTGNAGLKLKSDNPNLVIETIEPAFVGCLTLIKF